MNNASLITDQGCGFCRSDMSSRFFYSAFFQNAASVVCRPAIWQVQVWRLSHVVYNCNDITILPILNWFFEQCLDFRFFVIRFTHSLKHRRQCWMVACRTRSIWHACLIANSCSEKTIDACLQYHNVYTFANARLAPMHFCLRKTYVDSPCAIYLHKRMWHWVSFTEASDDTTPSTHIKSGFGDADSWIRIAMHSRTCTHHFKAEGHMNLSKLLQWPPQM